jgi:tetratricopeptide (TPR) repeat protein
MILNRIHIISVLSILPLSFLVSAQPGLDINYLKAKANLETMQYDSALVYLDKALVTRNNDKYILFDKGTALYFKGQYGMALQEFNKVEQVDKGRASIWIAKSYAHLNDIDNCLKSLQIHMSSNYKLPESKILLDKDLNIFENDPKWIKFWKTGNWYSALDKSLAEADYLIKTKKYPEAINVLSEALSKGFRKTSLYRLRAQVYMELNNYKLAISDLNNAIEGDSRNANLFAYRARINYLSGNYKQSLDDYISAIKLSPADLSLYTSRALSYNKNGMYAEALKDMNFYLNFFPKNDSAWYNFGEIYFEHENYMDALNCFNKSLALNTANPRYFAARGNTYLNTRTYKYAWKDFAMSLDLDPNNPEVYLNKGIASLKLGDNPDACYCFEMAKKLGSAKTDSFIEKYCK